MKIKCPFCSMVFDKDSDNLNFDLFAGHLYNHDTDKLAFWIKDKLIKIHEKIKEREKEIEYLQNKDTLYLSPLRRNEEELRILKSLLENK